MDKKLHSILVCPVSRSPLHYDRDNQEFISVVSGLAYPIRDGIPVMLQSEAREISLEEKEHWSSRPNPVGSYT